MHWERYNSILHARKLTKRVRQRDRWTHKVAAIAVMSALGVVSPVTSSDRAAAQDTI